MLNTIIRFSIRNKLIIGLFLVGLIGWGTYAITKLPIDALPDITSNQVQVITVSPTLAAPEVERLITFTVEQSTANIPGIKELRSISRFGLSVVTIVFDDNTDIYWARQQVAERLVTIKEQIPQGTGIPEMAPSTTGLGEVYQYVVKPKKGYESKYDLTELRSIQDWIIRRQLLGTKGVADVSSFGGKLKQYEVAVMPDKLKSMNTTVAEVFQALEQNNQNSGGSYIEKNSLALFIRTEGLAGSLDDIRSIVIKHTTGGIPVYLRDVADVRIGHAVRYGAMVYRDEGEVAGAVVLMLKGANASQVVKDVKKKMEGIRASLPEGVEVETFYDRTKMVTNAIGTVKKNLLEGALIVVFVLVLFLGNLRAGLIVASVIPLAMLFAIIMMNLFGVSGNLMSLGALDFGLIVDGAVIIVEAVMHRLYHTRSFSHVKSISRAEMDKEVGTAAGKMMNAAVFGQIIILIVYLPILSLVGIEGKMFKPMAQTVAFALIGAFILSLTYVPMITSLVLSKKLKHAPNLSDRMMAWLQSLYGPTLRKALAFPKLVAGVAVALFLIALFFMTRMGGEFIPELEEGDFAVDTRVLVGSSLSTSVAVSQQGAGLLLKQYPEIEKIVTRIGAGEIPTDPMPIEMGDMIILLKDKEEWTSAKTFDELANKMSATLSQVPGLTAGFQFPVQMRFNELISGARQDVVCKIFGENLDSLAVYAQKLGRIIQGVDGATDIFVETVTGLPQVVIRYDRAAMSRYQLNINEVNRLIRAAFAGESAGLVFENERRYDLVVRLNAQGRQQVNDIRELLIPSPMGMQIPLQQVASIEVKNGPNQIQREDAKRRIIVGFNVRGRDVQSLVQELQDKAGTRLGLPAGYYIHFGGQFQNLQEAKQRLSIAVPVALLLIFLMLYFSFGSMRHGLLIFSAIPLSAIGGVLALMVRDMPFSISAGVGFIALFGVAVLNGIVLLAEFNRLKTSGITDIKQLVMEGTAIRLRPVLMTAAVASLGFLPMALSHGPGAEVQRPLATVVIGGLLTATFLTLLVLPVLYVWVEKIPRRKKKGGAVAILVPLLLLASYNGHAQLPLQERISLDSLLVMADRQNLQLQSSRKRAEYWKLLQSGTVEPGKTQLSLEYGNVNSLNTDSKIMVGQGFSLPVVYRSQRQLYASRQLGEEALVKVQQLEIHRQVKLLYYRLLDMDARENLLRELDSVYSRFQSAAALRLEVGETNQLEKTAADAQMEQLRLQGKQLAADRLSTQEELAALLHSEAYYRPDTLTPVQRPIAVPDNVGGNPLLLWQQQQVNIARAEGAVEKAALTPDFSIAYFNQSFVGYQSKDGLSQEYFGSGRRFHAVGATVGIPIFRKATRTRIKAADINVSAARLQLDATSLSLQYRRKQLLADQQRYLLQAEHYNTIGKLQANALEEQARLAFTNGEIDYLQWTQLMNQSVNIRFNYLEALRSLNQNTIELEFINGK